MPSATIKDVARLAGVSTATVSRVINGNYYVSTEAKDKVCSAIEKTNYIPNSVARSLKGDNTYIIGYIVSDISNSYFTAIAKVIEDVVSLENYNIIVCSTENKKDREYNYIKMLIEKKVDGLIINTTGENDDFITMISQHTPVVLLNRRVYNDAFEGDFIDMSNDDGVKTLTDHLISYGHRRIGVINGDLSVSTGIERYKAFINALKKIGVQVDESYPYSFEGDFKVESGYNGASYLMGLDDRPTAIVIMNNAMTIGALKYFREKGIMIPDEVSIVSFGDIENIEVMYVQPCVMIFNSTSIGYKAGNMIMDRIHGSISVDREVIFSPLLLTGNTVKRI